MRTRRLLVTNVTRGKTLADSLEVADTFLKSLIGLIGQSSLRKGQGLWINPCQSVHTFWMRFPIDVLFLDQKGVVVDVIESMKPFRISKHFWKARSVLELPAASVRESSTQAGDLIEFSHD
ncbi:MAG: DUF192 domain-containing protein [Terriglobia bacterium]